MISLGLYISKESFFIVEVTLSGQTPKLLYLKETFWLDIESEEEKIALLSKQIKEREELHKGKSIRICCSLPQNFVSSFGLQLPFKERFKILKTIPFEVEDHTPFQANKVLFDAKVCQIQDNQARILSFVTPEESVHDFLDILKDLDRPIHLLSCSIASLVNLLESWNIPLSKPQNPDFSIDTYLYLGVENSYLFFYKQGFLQNVSVLDWGCGGIIDEMQSIYKLSREKTWQEFFNKAFLLTQVKGFTKEQVFFSNLIKKHTEQFIPKFNLLKMSLVAQKDFNISQMILFGPGAMIKNLSVFFTEQLALSVYKSRNLTAFPYWDWKEKPSALIAVGLTLEGLKKHPYPGLDFLYFQKQPPSLFSLKHLRNRIFIAVLALFILLSYSFVKKYETNQTLEQIQGVFKEYGRKIAYLSPGKFDVPEVEAFLEEQEQQKVAEGQIQKELLKTSPMDTLQRIVMKIGRAEDWDLSLEYLKISGLNVEMKGSLETMRIKAFQKLIQSLTSTKIEALEDDKSKAGDKQKTKALEDDKSKAGNKQKTESTEAKKSAEGTAGVKGVAEEGAENKEMAKKEELEEEAGGMMKKAKALKVAKEIAQGIAKSAKSIGSKMIEENKTKETATKEADNEDSRESFSYSFKLKSKF